MISKILVTLLLIAGLIAYVRARDGAAEPRQLPQAGTKKANRTALFVAIAFVALTLSLSGLLFYGHWSEQHQVLNVQVINSVAGNTQTYQVYKLDLGERSFRTIDGRLISLSDAERMEVQVNPE